MVLDVIRFFILFCYAPTQIITTTATITTMVISLATLSTSSNPCPRCSYNVTTYNRYDTFGFHHFFVPVCDNTNTPKKKRKKYTSKPNAKNQHSRRSLKTTDVYSTNSTKYFTYVHVRSVSLLVCYSMLFILEMLDCVEIDNYRSREFTIGIKFR